MEVIHCKKAFVWTWKVLGDEQKCFLFSVSFTFFITPPSLTWPWAGSEEAGVAAPSFKLLDGFVSCFPPVWTNADKKCRCLKISQIAENIWSVAFYLLLDGNSLFLQSVVLMEHPKLEAQNIALYSNISLCSLTNRVNSFYIRLCGE